MARIRGLGAGCGSGLLLASATFIAAGCSRPQADYGDLDLVQVRGKVTLDGQPLPAAAVVFESPDRTFSYAITDSAGRYRLMYNSEQPGVKPGPKTVRIRTGSDVTEEDGQLDESSPSAAANSVPARYNTHSELAVNVDGNTRTCDFELTCP